MLTSIALLSLAAVAFALPSSWVNTPFNTPPSTDPGADFTGTAPDNLSPCGASLYIGDLGGKDEFYIKTSTERDGSGEVVLLHVAQNNDNWLIKDPVGHYNGGDGSHFIDETADVDWANASISPFAIYQDKNFQCNSNACTPILEYVARTFVLPVLPLPP